MKIQKAKIISESENILKLKIRKFPNIFNRKLRKK